MALQPKEMTWSAYMAMLRRRWRMTSAAAGLVAFGTFYLAFALPAIYESSALILIEQQGIPPEFVQTTVNSYLDERIQAIRQRVAAAPNVVELIERLDLYPEERQTLTEDELIALFQDSIGLAQQNVMTVHPRSGRETILNYAFRVSFQHPDPVSARLVAEELARMYVSFNQTIRAESAARTTQFLDAEAAQLQLKLADVAERIATFKEQHARNLPEDQPVNLQMWTRAREDLTGIENRLRETRERKALLETELAETPPYRPVLDESGQPVRGGTVDRLAEAQQELIRLRGRYSENHPAIISLRREIAAFSTAPENQASLGQQLRLQIEARRQELSAALESYSESHPDVIRLRSTISSLENELAELNTSSRSGAVQPNNPIYISLITRIRTADEELADLTRQRDRLSAEIGELERRRLASPQVERDYSALMQEQEVLITQYRELRGLEGQAVLAENLEVGESSERFTIIEPPRTPTTPVSPNRLAISFLGMVLAIALGLGTASIADAADTSVRGQHDINELLDMPPIGIVPYVESRQDTIKRFTLNAAMGAAGIGAIAVIGFTALS